MTPAEFLDALDHAEARPAGRRGVVLELTRPKVLGQTGRYLGDNANGPVYGFTRRQCRAMRAAIAEAARADAGLVE